MSNTLVVVPCRGGSKGVLRKNMRKLLGKPLLAFPIQVALSLVRGLRVVLSSEDEEILDWGRRFGAMPLKRPHELAADSTPTLPVIEHALAVMESRDRCHYSQIVIMQATTPLVRRVDLEGVLDLMAIPGTDSAVSVVRDHRVSPGKIKEVVDGELRPAIEAEREGVRRQDLRSYFRRNGALYGLRRETLVDQKSLFGKVTRAHEMPEELSLEVDTELDFIVLESVLGNPTYRKRIADLGWSDLGVDSLGEN